MRKVTHQWECDECGEEVLFHQPELPQDNPHSEQNESKQCPLCEGDMFFDELYDESNPEPPADGYYNIADIKTMSPDLFDWEHSSRNTGETVPGLKVEEDGRIKLQCWLGLRPKAVTRDSKIISQSEHADIAIALEQSNGDWFWMHIADYSLDKYNPEPLNPDEIKLNNPITVDK